ncbi:MAG: tetratricopeptide repeat protein [bacterium]
MRTFVRFRWIVPGLLLLCLPCLISCAGSARRTADEDSRDTSFSLYSSQPEAELDKGLFQKREGNYQAAAELFLAVYKDRSADSEYRERALYELAQVHSHLLNPTKDYDQALSYLEKLITEFPDSEYRADAEEKIEHIKSVRPSGG